MASMMKIIIVSVLLAGCAGTNTMSSNNFYHKLSTKPTIIEQAVSIDERKVTVINPFNVVIEAIIDCDGEPERRHLIIAANSSDKFFVYAPEDISGRTCMFDTWWVQ
jgi:hypothetical protein